MRQAVQEAYLWVAVIAGIVAVVQIGLLWIDRPWKKKNRW